MKNEKQGLIEALFDTIGSDIQKKSEIFTTTNYDLFKKLNSNREISEKNKNKLISSLRQKNVEGASTILVKLHEDGFFYIYEGQHRFEALKTLNQPIDFIINQKLELDDISLINTASEVWVLRDFLKKYITKNKENDSYIKFKNLMEKYGTETDDESVKGITFTDLLFIITGWGTNVTQRFKEGTLIITDEQYNRANELCETLQPFLREGSIPVNINGRKFTRALLYMFERISGWEKTDTKNLLEYIKRNRALFDYKSYTNETMYVNLMVELYNRENKKKKRFIDYRTIKGGKEKVYYIGEDTTITKM